MKKFKARRILKIIWGISILFSACLGYIFYLALSALIWSPEPKVVNDLLGMLLTSVLLLGMWFAIIKRGCNEKIESKVKKVDLLTLPLEVENKVAGLMFVGIVFLLMGVGVLLITISNDTVDFVIVIVVFLLILSGGFLILQRLMAAGKVILSVDEVGITYRPTTLLKQQTIGPIPWSEITEIGIKTISTGRGSQSYFQVQALDPERYTLNKKRGILFEKVRQFGLRLTHDEKTAILAPLSLLKIKADALVLVCQHEQAKHQMNDHEILQEVEEPVREEEQLQPSPIEASSKISEARQSKQKLAYILTAMIFLAIAIFGGFSYLNTQNKYAGLKNKTQYIITTDEKENSEIILSFKIFADARSQYPVVLFATELDDNISIDRESIADLIKLQDGVIKEDKIYHLQSEGDNVASYSKFKVQKGSITLDLDNNMARLILGDADYLKLSELESNAKAGYIKAKLQYEDGETPENVRIYTVANLKKNYDLE